jgi:hypothetical protein
MDRVGPAPGGRVIVAIKNRGYVGWPRIADCGRSHRAIGVPIGKGVPGADPPLEVGAGGSPSYGSSMNGGA